MVSPRVPRVFLSTHFIGTWYLGNHVAKSNTACIFAVEYDLPHLTARDLSFP